MPQDLSLVIVGSIALDSIRTPFGEHETILGGSACYAGVSASFLTHVGLVGVVGHDFPAVHRHFLEGRGLDLAGVYEGDGKTFHWKGYYEGSMNNAITVDTQLGVFEFFNPEIPAAYRSAPNLFLGNIHPALQLRVLEQLPRTARVGLDTMNFWINSEPELLKEVVSKVEIVFLNEAEIQQYTGIANLVEAAHAVLGQGPSVVVLKRGAHGATVHCEAGIAAVPALPLDDVKDPTGAGDTFAGGFLGYLAQTGGDLSLDRLREALWVGTAMASFAVQDFSLTGLVRAGHTGIVARCQELETMVCGRVPNLSVRVT